MSTHDPRRPNIVVLHWHDLGRHLGTYGVGSVTSPALDALADSGVRFDNAYCTAPLCSPARASIATGRYPHSTGMHGLAHRGFGYQPGERRLPAYLSEAGYRTALLGVQHESDDPQTLDYDEVIAAYGSDRHAPRVAAAAETWIADAAAGDQPFFAMIGFVEVHRPYPPERYEPDDPSTVDVPGWLPDNEWTRDDLAAFQGCIRVADQAAGRVFAALDRAGIADDTWVIFTTDHGPGFPGGKSTLYDAGIGVALIQRFPAGWGVPPGPVERLFSHVDLVPTILDRLELPVPATVQGVSHAAWIADPAASPARDRIYAEKSYHNHYDPIRCVRTASAKLIRSYEERPHLVLPPGIERCATRFGYGDEHLRHRAPVELYDLDIDPYERTNLAADPAYANLRQDLADNLTRWQQATGDPILDGPIPGAPWPRMAKFGALV